MRVLIFLAWAALLTRWGTFMCIPGQMTCPITPDRFVGLWWTSGCPGKLCLTPTFEHRPIGTLICSPVSVLSEEPVRDGDRYWTPQINLNGSVWKCGDLPVEEEDS